MWASDVEKDSLVRTLQTQSPSSARILAKADILIKNLKQFKNSLSSRIFFNKSEQTRAQVQKQTTSYYMLYCCLVVMIASLFSSSWKSMHDRAIPSFPLTQGVFEAACFFGLGTDCWWAPPPIQEAHPSWIKRHNILSLSYTYHRP